MIKTRDNECSTCRLKSELGDAILTRYEVYPGIALVYNDVHTDHVSVEADIEYKNVLEINHCREGRIEFESQEGEVFYIKKGDMAINLKTAVKEYSFFPKSHYHGVTIEIDLDEIKINKNIIMEELHLKPEELKNHFCKCNQCYVIREIQQFEHLFTELHCVPEKIKMKYYKIKVIEIILFLLEIEPSQERIENRYFNKDLVIKTKEIHEYMLHHMDEKITIDFFANRYGISTTNLKKCFKEIYGQSMYAYLKEARIKKAAALIRGTDLEIGRIAGLVGYDNASKFANSFKSIIGINPSEYKKSV